ncbi:hypothetical protein GCM10027598_38890 [Amycolatopsis oliviviridis]
MISSAAAATPGTSPASATPVPLAASHLRNSRLLDPAAAMRTPALPPKIPRVARFNSPPGRGRKEREGPLPELSTK